MDLNQIDGISAVLGAIAASAGVGAGEAVKDATKDIVTSAKDRLIALVRGRLRDDPVGDAKLTVYAADPSPANAHALHGHLTDACVDQDESILTLAREVIHAAGPAALAPGSVAATVINQINKDGGTGFIGGHHVHHHGPQPALRVTWDLFRLEGDEYELRNIGTTTATDVSVDANVDLGWPLRLDRDIPDGSSVMFICSPSVSDPSPVVTVTWSISGISGRQRWQRPIPR